MAKERSDAERAERKAAKAKAKAEAKADETAGEEKPLKKEMKREHSDDEDEETAPKKRKRDSHVSEHEAQDPEENAANGEEAVETPPVLVSFAEPLATGKALAKILKAVKRCQILRPVCLHNVTNERCIAVAHKALKRGVKEITKTARKTPETGRGNYTHAPAIAIFASDVFPEDVIAHLPVFLEDKSIPFIFVPSRKGLGEAGNTKRPTSCLLLLRVPPGKKAGEAPDPKWEETFKSILKLVLHERKKCTW